MNLPLLTFYGLGTTIGAGIYALLGKVAGVAGMLAPLAFTVACGLAALSALSYAELSTRLPRAGGEAIYVQAGFQRPYLTRLVGVLITLTSVVSAATIAQAGLGYVGVFVILPYSVGLTGIVGLLGALSVWGIEESTRVAAALTIIEIGALVLLIVLGIATVRPTDAFWQHLTTPAFAEAGRGVLVGAFLAFYAFLGFEDMVNVAEEVRNVRHTMPMAIGLTLLGSSLLYMSVALVAVMAIPPHELAASPAPMSTLYQRLTGASPAMISLVSIFAVLNGALIQIIKTARLLYGLAQEGFLPLALARVHPRTRTPVLATVLVTLAIFLLALLLRLETLAATTSAMALSVFALSNLALVRLKRRALPPGEAPFLVPVWVPVLGCGVSAAFVLVGVGEWLLGRG